MDEVVSLVVVADTVEVVSLAVVVVVSLAVVDEFSVTLEVVSLTVVEASVFETVVV